MARELVENALTFDPNGYRAQLLNLFVKGITPTEEE